MTTMRLMTADELLNMPAENMRHELVAGELITMAPTGGEHGTFTIELGGDIRNFVKQNKLGKCFGAETGFVITHNPDTVRAPDFAFIQAGRIPAAGIGRGFVSVVPDFVFEVLSPSDSASEVLEKIDQWLNAGTKLVWVIDPVRKSLKAFAPGRQAITYSPSDQASGEDVLPGLLLPVSEIFR